MSTPDLDHLRVVAVAAILAARPDDGIMGEEDQGDRPGTTGLRWVLDPLDGTVNYLQRIPQWCVSVACEDEVGPLVGVVHHPDLDETFVATRGGGAWLGEQRLAVTDPGLGAALLTTGFAYDQDLRPRQLDAFARWGRHVRYVRRLGALRWIWHGSPPAVATSTPRPVCTGGTSAPARCWSPRPAVVSATWRSTTAGSCA